MLRLQGWKDPLLPLQWATLFLSLFIISVCHGEKPQMDPNMSELTINEGEALEITCTSTSQVYFKYPNENKENNVTRFEYNITHDQKYEKTTFRRSSTVFGDTGWYGCINKNKTITKIEYDNPNVSWMYVYVKSNKSAFVHNYDGYLQRKIRVGHQAILPCRPTSSEFNVTLMLLNDFEPKPMVSNRIHFNPKYGFIIEKSELRDSGNYTCEVNQNGVSQKINVSLLIIKKVQVKPMIEVDGLEQVIAGSSLNVKCSVEIEMDIPFDIFWETPSNSSSRKILHPVEKNRGRYMLVTSELTINNVTLDDEGNYTCTVKSSYSEQDSTHMYIKIHDPNNTYINLTSDKVNRVFIVELGQPITFVVHIDAFPRPTLKWRDFYNREIVSGKDFIISNNMMTSSLTVKKAKFINIFTLYANNTAGVKFLDFSLKVKTRGPPDVFLMNNDTEQPFYTINENTTFTCHSYSYPEVNISWFYKQCPTYNSDDGCIESKLEGKAMSLQYDTEDSSSLTINITSFGRITCTSCNQHFCGSKEKNINIVDEKLVEKPFKLDKEYEDSIVGDNVTVTCTVVNYMYPKLTWMKYDDVSGNYTEIMNTTRKNTKYISSAVLSIKNVQISDGGSYVCKVWDVNEHETVAYYMLWVKDPEIPTFIDTNMNDTEKIMSLRDALNTINLICKAKGTPKPSITWYKDGTPLKSSEQFSLVENNKKLIIKHLLDSDSGNYSCLAKNRFGEVRKSQKFIVKGHVC